MIPSRTLSTAFPVNSFNSADTLVRNQDNPQWFVRYSYSLNNPIYYTDPSGHLVCESANDSCAVIELEAEPLPVGGDGVDGTGWLRRQMITNVRSQKVKYLYDLNSHEGSLRDRLANRLAALLIYKDLVNTGQDWDFKTDFKDLRITQVTLVDQDLRMDIVANIHYGYIGTEAGFSPLELFVGAGIAQQRGVAADLGEWWAFFDEPVDQEAIVLGIELSVNYGEWLTEDQFVESINRYLDEGLLSEYLVNDE